jgi:membrane protease subunit (stomatin/prohibitin family)
MLEIAPHMDEISEYATQRIKSEFERYGLDVVNFFIQSINFPDEDFDAINSVLEKRAEFDLMGDARYATARTFDVYEGAANNKNGIAGAFMAGGVGLGARMTMGAQMPPVIGNAAPNGTVCPKCYTNNPAGTKFCPNCGESITVQQVKKASAGNVGRR